MGLEAYKIAVQVSLIDNVTKGLSSLSRHFISTNRSAAELQNRLNGIKKDAMLGGAMLGAGAFGLKMLQGPLEEAKKYQHEMTKLKAQGIGDAALAQADKYARAQNIIGASSTDTMKMVAEANSVLRDMHHAELVTPTLLKMKFGIESVMGDGHGEKAERMFMDALKVGELRGALVDQKTQQFDLTKFNQTMDFMTKAYTASGGLVQPTQYLNLIKTGGIAAKSLDDQSFYFGLMHMMQEMGGSRVGTSLMSGFQNMYMGRTTQQVAEEMKKDGLLQANMIHYGKTGHITKVDPAAIQQAELFRTNQFKYLTDVIMPMLQKRGVHDGAEMEMAISKLFSNRTAGNLWQTMYKERANIQKHMDAAGSALGVDGLANAGAKTMQGEDLQYEAQMASLKLELGQNILPMAISGLQMLNSLLKSVTDFTKEFPNLTTFIVTSTAVLSALLVAGGSIMLMKAALGALGIASEFTVLGVGVKTLMGNLVGLGRGAIGLVARLGSLSGVLGTAGLGLAAGVAVIEIGRLLFAIKGLWDINHREGVKLSGSAAARLNDPAIQAQLNAMDADRKNVSYAKPSSGSPIQVHTQVNMDGRAVANVVSKHQANETTAASRSGGQFDPTMSLLNPAMGF